MKTKLISIIIPCYNAEAYLPRCFASLQKQTIGMENLELIFLDDASTDHTWDTLQAIENACPSSVLIVHCDENSGAGAVRNLGLSYASCPYVAFLDADDWVEPDMYQLLYDKMVQYHCDIVRCHFIRDYGVSETVLSDSPLTPDDRLLLIDTIEKRKAFLLTDSLGTTVWDKLFCREFLARHHLTFEEGLAYEEHSFCSLLYLYARHVYILEKQLYHYYVNDTSIVLKKDADYHHDYLLAELLKWQEWEQRGFLEYYRSELECNFLLDAYIGYLKVLFLRFRELPYTHFLNLKKEILARIPNYRENPYLTTSFTPLNQILLELLSFDPSPEELKEIALSARAVWQNVTIFTATHIAFTPPGDKTYLPLHVGRAAGEDLGYLGDDTGDNISLINCYYGELTGLYWIWKNYHQADYVGLCHYRRYFLNGQHNIMSQTDYLRLFTSYDVIISKPVISDLTYYQTYQEAHNINDLLTVGEAIRRLYPDDYPIFQEVLEGHAIYSGNLFATSKSLFNQYADWLFTILKDASRGIEPDAYDSYHRRVFGFLSEQLIYVWVRGRNLLYYECEIGFTQEKAETAELKNALAELISAGEIALAQKLFRERIKERPDVLLPASDLSQELRTIYQLLHVCEKEQQQGCHSFLNYSNSLPTLIAHYTRITEILYHMSQNKVTAEDLDYIRKTGVSKAAMQTIIDVTPAYGQIRLSTWL